MPSSSARSPWSHRISAGYVSGSFYAFDEVEHSVDGSAATTPEPGILPSLPPHLVRTRQIVDRAPGDFSGEVQSTICHDAQQHGS
ncbi:hypothetical protein E5345_00960 [Propionibacterium sp. NM47_B9-13]|uniref:Uncharacterized protein n=1 Tax=Cutibacterium modestum HL044PA1 TaxID=765109 RepID=A0ABP2KCD1_9ACTN|nr:hypothetical protein HMPREF9607_00370 [Cutibacterium modestum HL044PA1]EFT14703.1 hypothetical protein HMPREF9622_02273 [Cutibacterium modestum HL037PA3]REB73488.1 hypothetical protein CP877_07840 [Cutibacterium modestum]TGY29892.1 hypothetical protein E5345_00960 [Propionibacterium sp. NM47_B9-13]